MNQDGNRPRPYPTTQLESTCGYFEVNASPIGTVTDLRKRVTCLSKPQLATQLLDWHSGLAFLDRTARRPKLQMNSREYGTDLSTRQWLI